MTRNVKHCPSCVEATEGTTRYLPQGSAHSAHPCDLTDRPHGNPVSTSYQSGRHCVAVEVHAQHEALTKDQPRHEVRDALHTISVTPDDESRDLLSDHMLRTK